MVVLVIVWYWRCWWHSGGDIEVVAVVVTAFVRVAVVLVVGAP